MPPISAVIIAYNEAEKIADCIRSLQGVADEILVLDSFSTDATPEICQGLGVRFEQQAFAGYIEQKNAAMRLASYDHVLALDADEALDENLRQSILTIKNNWTHDAYEMNRLNNYAGRWVRHSGWYPDRKTRLWDRKLGHWGGTNPHDRVVLEKGARLRHIEGDILHRTVSSIEQHIAQSNKFSSIKARHIQHKSSFALVFKFLFSPPFQFFKSYLLKRGFLDGKEGLSIALVSAFFVRMAYFKALCLKWGGKG
jgi:glycosyltransferase involved in cell wall biosynthesis